MSDVIFQSLGELGSNFSSGLALTREANRRVEAKCGLVLSQSCTPIFLALEFLSP